MPELIAAQAPHAALHAPHSGKIPMVGLNTWPLTGHQAYEVTLTALELGYRHIDTAAIFGNEVEIGAALRDSQIRREDVFIASKLPPNQPGHEQEALDGSLAALDVDYLDLWLIHSLPDDASLIPMWESMLAAQQAGLAKAVGVSGFSPAHIDQLIAATGVAPAVNQITWSPHRFNPELLLHATHHHILIEGYSPFTIRSLDEPALREIAERHEVSPIQVFVRWHLDTGVIAIPRGTNYEQLEANLNALSLTLSADEIAALNGLAL